MAFSLGTLNPFVNETAMQLVKKAVLTGKTIDMVSLVPGIKYKQTLNILDNDPYVAYATCGFSSSGSVAITQREIQVTAFEIKESLCEKNLEQYFVGQWMKAGSPKEEELGPILAESYVEKVKAYNEVQIWTGDYNTSSVSMDGILTILSASGNTKNVSGSAGTHTANNIIAHVDAMVAATPEAILDKTDLVLFMSYANYMLYTSALRTANLYNYKDFSNGSEFEVYIPGTTIKAVATKGLTGKNNMVLTYASNIVVGTDLANEEEKFDIWYSRDNDEVRVNIQWKLGVQVYFPEFCVTNFA